MQNVYLLKFNLESSAHQDQIMQLFKTRGDDVVQASDGLCVKSALNESEVKKALEEKDLAGGVAIEAVDSEKKEELAPSVQSFIEADA